MPVTPFYMHNILHMRGLFVKIFFCDYTFIGESLTHRHALFRLWKIYSLHERLKAEVLPDFHVQFRLEAQKQAHQDYQSQCDHQIFHRAALSSPRLDT